MEENLFNLIQNIKDANYAENIAIQINSPTQAESLLHSLERALGGIGLHVNADKTKYFNQSGDVSILKGGPLKLVEKFT